MFNTFTEFKYFYRFDILSKKNMRLINNFIILIAVVFKRKLVLF